jgi:hypothetical protein
MKYIILRNKYKFNIQEITKDNIWIYLKGECKELLGNRITVICIKLNEKYRIIK